MNIYWILPLCVGTVTVLQGVLNRKMGEAFGLSSAVLLNGVITMVLAAGLFAASRLRPGLLPPLFQAKGGDISWAWWMVLPGIFGMMIISGIPWAISKLGPSKVFIGIVVAQVLVSMLWDALVEGRPVGALRVGGAGLALVGVVMASMDR